MRWFPLTSLPDEIIDYPAAGIDAYRNGAKFSIHGWDTRSHAGQSRPVGPIQRGRHDRRAAAI